MRTDPVRRDSRKSTSGRCDSFSKRGPFGPCLRTLNGITSRVPSLRQRQKYARRSGEGRGPCNPVEPERRKHLWSAISDQGRARRFVFEDSGHDGPRTCRTVLSRLVAGVYVRTRPSTRCTCLPPLPIFSNRETAFRLTRASALKRTVRGMRPSSNLRESWSFTPSNVGASECPVR